MTTTASRDNAIGRIPAGGSGWRERVTAAVRPAYTRHLGITLLVLAGAALRAAVTFAYVPAFWYPDSGAYIRLSQYGPEPDLWRPVGYVMFLKVLRVTGSMLSVVTVQHLLGLALAVAVYVLLQRRGLPRWLSCLAAVPLLFDSLVLTIEQFVLVETLFTALLVAGVLALLWERTPTMWACAAGGGLLAMAWFTKPLALPVFPVLLVYLLLGRVGWRGITAFAAAFVLPYLAVIAWVDGRPSTYGSNSAATYARVAGFADCERLEVTPAERALCPGPDQRFDRPDLYIWAANAPAYTHRHTTDLYPQMRTFTVKVLVTQPGDYLRVVGKEIAALADRLGAQQRDHESQ